MKQRAILSITQIVLSLAGFLIAGTLFYAHTHNVDLPCSSGNGCDLVNASRWAMIGPIPVSLLGALGYGVIALASVLKLTDERESFARGALAVILAMTTGGVLYSWYLQYVAHVYIGAFCIYCRSSAIVMSVLFASAVYEAIMTYRKPVAPAADVPAESVAPQRTAV